MTNRDPHDRIPAGLIARTLGRVLDASGRDCPGPDVLGAFFERSLGASETDRWEPHIAGCARCQEQLAVLVRTEHAIESAPRRRGLDFTRAWRWAVPAAVGATALALWIAVRPDRPAEPTPRPSSQHEAQAPAGTTAHPAPTDTRSVDRQALADEGQPSELDRLASQPDAGIARKKPRQDRAQEAETRLAQLADRAESPTPGVPAAGTPAPPDSGRAANVAPRENRMLEPIAEERAALQKAEAPLPGPRPDAVPKTAVLDEKAVVAPRAETSVAPGVAGAEPLRPTGADSARESGQKGRLQETPMRPMRAPASVQPAGSFLIASPTRAVLWRVRARAIDRSGDGGLTWTALGRPVEIDLVAGSAVSDTVCWIVGRAGIVLRTTDGERWERVLSPTARDLLKVEARDALHVTVADADGRRYATADGGRSWQPTP